MSNTSTISIGDPLSRVDGRAKVTGTAKYAADFSCPSLMQAVLVMSTIAKGRIAKIDTLEARKVSGVIAVITSENALKLHKKERRLSLLQDNKIFYNNQPIAIVVAERLHEAQYAASLIRPEYKCSPPKLNFKAGFRGSYTYDHAGEPGDQRWGSVKAGLEQASIKIDQIYTTPIHHHNPMEPHATVAEWKGNHLHLYDSTQHISGVKEKTAEIFGIPKTHVHVTCLFTGGGFGCKGEMWSHVVLAALAAKQVKKPVKLVLDRPQMFGPVGARPCTHQHLTIGATTEGKLTAIRHEVHAHTSVIEDYLESAAFPARVMYACPNVSTISRVVPINLGTPTYMRAPGVATGTFAVEVAMDELAYILKMDPLQLRLLNYAEVDPHTQKPFTEKHLRECYAQGAARFGWSKRNHTPGSMHEGEQLIGWGMATETYPGKNMPATALVCLQSDGRVLVASGTQEIGTGMYTIMTQVVADILGVSLTIIDARLGDTSLPQAPLSAGSMSTASILPAVKAAAEQVKEKLIKMAIKDRQSPLFEAPFEDIDFKDGGVILKSNPTKSESFASLLKRNGRQSIEVKANNAPQLDEKTPCHSFGAIFAEVAVDQKLGTISVRRIVAVYDVGRIINLKTATSQFISGIIWGIGLALQEKTYIDWRYGRIINANLADYLVPVNADIKSIDVSALDIPDYKLDSLGARGVGEIGITGTAAAISNAVFHATGKRIRDLPITADKLFT